MITPHSLHIPRSTLQIALKGLGDIEHLDNVFHTEGFLLVDGEGLGGADGVFDLSHVRLAMCYVTMKRE